MNQNIIIILLFINQLILVFLFSIYRYKLKELKYKMNKYIKENDKFLIFLCNFLFPPPPTHGDN